MSRKEKSYSVELKYQAVSDYLSGKGSLREICRKYKIRSTRQLRNWIKMYNGHKELKCYTGGSRMTKGRKTTYGHTFTSREQLISTIESYIDYYNNRRYQHRLFIQTPLQAHVCAMNRAARPTNCTKNSPFLCRNGE
ncbi:IS3 family transposase [Faecalibacterium prausnitzii]